VRFHGAVTTAEGSCGCNLTTAPTARPPYRMPSSIAVKVSGIDLKTIVGRDVVLVEDIIDTGESRPRLPLLCCPRREMLAFIAV